MRRGGLWLIGVVALACWGGAAAAGETLVVKDRGSLHTALKRATPGTCIRILPGTQTRGTDISNLQGTAEQPIVIEGANPRQPPVFQGGKDGWHLSGCNYVTLRHLALRGQKQNGVHVDDGGKPNTPSHHIRLEHISVGEVGPEGNCDGLKISGVDDFVIQDCDVEGWGGASIDMVGCHRGRIDRCVFRGKPNCSQRVGIQVKGGSSQVSIQRCLFVDAGDRAINIGGCTGLKYFRPQGALYEAKDILIQGCVFVGSEAALAFVGIDGAAARYNTIYHPKKYVMRILQETREPGFVPSRNGEFSRNLVVFRHSDVRSFVGVGAQTAPDTFRFAENLWYCDDEPGASRPSLPSEEQGGIYGVDPQLAGAAQGRYEPRDSKAAGFGASAWREEKTEKPAAGRERESQETMTGKGDGRGETRKDVK